MDVQALQTILAGGSQGKHWIYPEVLYSTA